MASFTAGDSIDWLWGGLKPWQILHSTLADRERCGNVQDVWELVNQTLSTTSKSCHGEEADRGRSREIQFLGDLMDGDFWRHGGVIELRVKECLNSLLISQNDEVEEDDCQQNPAADHQLYRGPYKCTGTEVTIASSTHELPYIAWRSVADADHSRQLYCQIRQDSSEQAGITLQENYAAAAADDLQEEHAENQGFHGYSDGETEEEEDDDDDEEEIEDDSGNCRDSMQRIREANNGVITRRNHLTSHNDRDSVKDGSSILVLNPYCCGNSAAISTAHRAAAVDIWGDDQSTDQKAEGSTAAAVSEEVCAVCLEKLTHCHEGGGVQALGCRHAFHRVCIEPWLQREAQACCPCCRAPILAEALAPPLHSWADHHLVQDGRRYGGGGGGGGQAEDQAAGMGIMGVLADVEAALERLGFRS